MKIYSILLTIGFWLTAVNPATASKWVSGYYMGYQRDLYPIEKIDFSALTHLIVGRIVPNSDGTIIKNFDIDDINGPLMARDLGKRAHITGTKALLMVGGAGIDSWSEAASPTTRSKFVKNLIGTMKEFGYDGLDLDWEPIDEVDYPKLIALARELRAAEPKIILTIPLAWSTSNSPKTDAFLAELARHFDQVNLMSYYMADNWPGWQSWHSSALEGHAPHYPSSIEATVHTHLKAGVPAGKLGIGIGFFGACWTGVSKPRQSGGRVIADDNAMSYANIMKDYFVQANRKWDKEAKVPYLSFASPNGPKGCTFISYEDPESIKIKGDYVHKSGLGGTIIWTINQGYISGKPSSSSNPPLEAVKRSFLLQSTACDNGSNRCDGDKLQQCNNGKWDDAVNCEATGKKCVVVQGAAKCQSLARPQNSGCGCQTVGAAARR
jgi:chitinase